MIHIFSLLKLMNEKNASDLHLRVGVRPVVRVNGELYRLQTDPLTKEEMEQILQTILKPSQIEVFNATNELDLA
ncbi:MAG: hypothetical protein N2053_04985, partial [Chitinispirillaceae bacterium]|nr:hypothetical protein [Chitinispirillaceae bacterium]